MTEQNFTDVARTRPPQVQQQQTDGIRMSQTFEEMIAEMRQSSASAVLDDETRRLPRIPSPPSVRKKYAPPSTAYPTRPRMPTPIRAAEFVYVLDHVSPRQLVALAVDDFKLLYNRLPKYIYIPDRRVRGYVIDTYRRTGVEIHVMAYGCPCGDGNPYEQIPVLSDALLTFSLKLNSVMCSDK
jgi:hypothetical protein